MDMIRVLWVKTAPAVDTSNNGLMVMDAIRLKDTSYDTGT